MQQHAGIREMPVACQASGAERRGNSAGKLRQFSGSLLPQKSAPSSSSKSRQSCQKVFAAKRGQETADQPAFLSDIIAFQSDDREGAARERQEGGGGQKDAEELVDRATRALESARKALENHQERTPSRPVDSLFTYASNREDFRTERRSGEDASSAQTRSVLKESLSSSPEAAPSNGSGPQLQPDKQPQQAERRQLEFAEPPSAFFELVSQDAQDAEAAKSKVLPPFQSVLELTTAAAPPQRGGEAGSVATAAPSAAHSLADGEGRLADGTLFRRESGETRGKDGYWFRWTKLSGVSPGGQVEWEERWWEASDWAGMKEMGAEKSGCSADGGAWRETWREAIGFDEASGEPLVERTAHKWAADGQGDEWEEKWGEHYWSKGRARKWADKWGRDGADVWHERWGEEYPGGDACFKYTDKWAERALAEGGVEQWGDKWEEDFAGGKGNKKGETWSVSAAGERYQRWWGEAHFGDGWVQKFGNSSTGEHWDLKEFMDTYYNPVPHFGFQLALDHSPTLKNVKKLPRVTDDLGDGLSSL